MKYFLCNLTWGRGSVGDEAILAGLLTKYDKTDVIVGSYDPEETHNTFGVEAVNEDTVVNADTLVIGGGFIYDSSVDGLKILIEKYRKEGSRIEIRAIQFFPSSQPVVQLLKDADYVTIRYKALASQLDFQYESDFAFHCPTQPWKHGFHGWIGYNAFHVCGGGVISETSDIPLPEGKVIGIASVRHKTDKREDDFLALDKKNCDVYYYSVNPMKVKYLLSTLKCMYSQRKHLALLAHISGTPTYYFGKTHANRAVVKEWGVPII